MNSLINLEGLKPHRGHRFVAPNQIRVFCASGATLGAAPKGADAYTPTYATKR